ncbi:MAG TPA: sigma-70 family RNA polymerase sigma factor [Xanthobacteraceae bacterium]
MFAIANSSQRLELSRKGAGSETTQFSQEASDRALIRAVAAGDKPAMHTLYVRHNVRVFRFILRMTDNRSLAEDLVSEVFLDVWRKADGFKAKSQVSTWLLAIARNKVLSSLRRRSDEELDDDALAVIEDPADDPETLAQKRDRSNIVQKCLAQLSAAHREVLDLVYYHEKSVDEISEIIRIPASTVKTRMFYARSRMETFLRSAGVEAL